MKKYVFTIQTKQKKQKRITKYSRTMEGAYTRLLGTNGFVRVLDYFVKKKNLNK